MVYCQKCGASNIDDARFCNMCGAPIAREGEPGGPIEPDTPGPATLRGHDSPPLASRSTPGEAKAEVRAARAPAEAREDRGRARDAASVTPPPMSLDASTVSLSAIGVRSPAKAWMVLVAIALALVGVGAAGMWLGLRAEQAPPEALAVAEGAQEPPPIEIGEPIPSDADLLEANGPAVTTRGSEGPASSSGARTRRRSGADAPARTGRSRSGAGRSSGASGGSRGATGSGGPQGSGGSQSSGGGSQSSHGSGSGSSEGSGGSGSSSGSSSEPDWDSMQEQQQGENDMQMQLYTGRLRQFIRTYYARRAASCFDMASRNHPQVRGRVVLSFSIQADGTTRSTRVQENQTGVESLAGCLVSQVSRWRLPPPPEGEAPLAMSMPFRGSGM